MERSSARVQTASVAWGKKAGSPSKRSYHARAEPKSRTRSPANRCNDMAEGWRTPMLTQSCDRLAAAASEGQADPGPYGDGRRSCASARGRRHRKREAQRRVIAAV